MTFTVSAAVSMAAGSSMEILFALINALQIIHFIPMMTLFFPPHARVMFSFVSVANMDNAMMAYIFSFFVDEAQLQGTPFNERFER